MPLKLLPEVWYACMWLQDTALQVMPVAAGKYVRLYKVPLMSGTYLPIVAM